MKLELSNDELGSLLDAVYFRRFHLEKLSNKCGDDYGYYSRAINNLKNIELKIKYYWGENGQDDTEESI